MIRTLIFTISLLLSTSLVHAQMPVGTVVAFAGNINALPAGWLLCDGTRYSSATYPALYAIIGTIWGNGDGSAGSFNVPDMQGMFLRGVDVQNSGVKNDPDREYRTSRKLGGQTGNSVGSYQSDTIRSHSHEYAVQRSGNTAKAQIDVQPLSGNGPFPDANPQYNVSLMSNGGGYTFYRTTIDGPSSANIKNSPAFDYGNETRPKNVYVHYIIKY